MLWATGVDLLSNEPVDVPYSLVHINAVPPFPPGDACFFVTSNGLASGVTESEAIVHAICEVIERDGVSRWRQAPAARRAERWIDLDSVTGAAPRALLAQCADAGFEALACDVGSPVGLAVVVCVLFDTQAPSDTLRGAAMGFGCHLRRDTALIRALTEAAQSRLTLIAGSRDDLDRQDYEARRRHRDGIESYRRILDASHPVDFRTLPDLPAASHVDQIEILLGRLRSAGVHEVAKVVLGPTPEGIAVVRVIVPGLRGPDHAH
jgi:ribosomal protein S12 methylthiotransferase accessory factor